MDATESRLLRLETKMELQTEVIDVMLRILRNHPESEEQALIYELLRKRLAYTHVWPSEWDLRVL